MRVSAKLDYGLRALAELAAREPGAHVTGDELATRQDIPKQFLENILAELRIASLVATRRGHDGGYRLARPAAEISVAEVVAVLEGPLGDVHGVPAEAVTFDGPSAALRDVWLATESALRRVLGHVSLAHIAAGALPADISVLASDARP